MFTITNSMEWVYHDRGKIEPSLVRKYQEECWMQGGFGKYKKEDDLIYEFNTRWLRDGNQVILLNPTDPVEMIHHVKKLFQNSNYDVALTIKNDRAMSKATMFI